MAELTVSTPKKHHLQDRCVLCGMVFCNVEITPSGRKIKTSVNMNKKLKITKQTVDDLHLVIDMDLTSTDATGICIKCNRLVKGVVEKLQIIKQTLNESIGYSQLQNVLADPDHEENYWVNSIENDNFKCHFCNASNNIVKKLAYIFDGITAVINSISPTTFRIAMGIAILKIAPTFIP
ncbi:hypothetical protein MAR_027567 [Mya arenaria]|uniref:ZAD domain-containing protein n=1 Tax=Mya arenaria TaxID=6604 RepID=A0ABY7ETU5_MYAAR|nr:hypothetical protein MAR_027567 [Mya arenaria]